MGGGEGPETMPNSAVTSRVRSETMSDSSVLPPESLWIKMGSDVRHFRVSLRVCEWCLVAGGWREWRREGAKSRGYVQCP